MKNIKIFHDSGSIDIKIISQFEENFAISLPLEYKKFISMHNEAYLVDSFFKFKNIHYEKDDCRDISFYGYGEAITNSSQIEKKQNHDIYGHDMVIAFGCSANGDYICFDYRHNPQTKNPPVVLMIHDDVDQNNKMLICPVADNFEQFMDSLYKADDEN